MALMPVTVMVLGHYFLPDEKISVQRLFGAAIGFLGVFVLIGANLTVGGDKLAGQLATIAATFAYASNAIYTKRLPSFEPAGVTAGSLIIGVVVLAIPMVWFQPAKPLDSLVALESALQPILAVSVLGILGTGIATWFYFEVVRQVGPGFLSTINYLIPGFAFFVGIAFLGESGGLPQLLSLALIVAGVWLIQPKHKVIQAD